MQLASFATHEFEEKNDAIINSGYLVSNCIRDLRTMCKNFYPDEELRNENGLKDGIESTLRILHLSNEPKVRIEGIPQAVSHAMEIIIFKVAQDVLIAISNSRMAYKDLVISYTEQQMKLRIDYIGKVIDLDSDEDDVDAAHCLTISETLNLVRGVLDFNQGVADHTTSIIFTVPINTSL